MPLSHMGPLIADLVGTESIAAVKGGSDEQDASGFNVPGMPRSRPS